MHKPPRPAHRERLGGGSFVSPSLGLLSVSHMHEVSGSRQDTLLHAEPSGRRRLLSSCRAEAGRWS